mgnify:CR=1 FL=1
MPFPMKRQALDLWCWAAVSAATEKYFNPLTAKTQCSIASDVKQTRCCPRKEVCNTVDSLELALSKIGRLRAPVVTGPIPFDQIRNEIRDGFPVAARIAWNGGGGHFVVITGYRKYPSRQEVITIADPLGTGGRWLYDDFVHAYQLTGVWTHTYFLRP